MFRTIHKLATRPFINNKYNFKFCTALPLSLGEAINKIVVTRSPSQIYSFYVDYGETVEQFKERISRQFPNSTIAVISSNPDAQDLRQESKQNQANKWYQQIKASPLIDNLIYNKIVFCQFAQDKLPQIIYGIQVAEHNLTNRINIPEYIEEGVAELNKEWEGNMTVGDALKFENIRRFQDGTLAAQTGKPLTNNLSQFEQQTLQSSIQSLMKMKQYNLKSQGTIFTNSASKLMKRIILLMSTNWLLLFAITYGKYGWDVGQPIAYLTDLSVDFVAMLGVFNAETALQSRAQQEKQFIQAIMNLNANQRMNQWRVAYLSRKIMVD